MSDRGRNRSSEFDCQKCGACCASFDVLLDPVDADHFEARPHLISLTILQYADGEASELPPRRSGGQRLRFMRRDAAGQCVALSGPLSDCGCTIYADRPHLCRLFEAGSAECLAARTAHSI